MDAQTESYHKETRLKREQTVQSGHTQFIDWEDAKHCSNQLTKNRSSFTRED